MSIDREDTLKRAEKLLRQGRLEGAIAEYVRLVEDQPQDWAAANALGDLYGRLGQLDLAAGQYVRIAEHFFADGFYSKAAALYKKLLKLNPDDEGSQLRLGEISSTQGLLADAKASFGAVLSRRQARGDRAGAAEMIVRIASLDPADLDARLGAARSLADGGRQQEAAARLRELHADLLEKGRGAEALEALREAVRLDPTDRAGRSLLAKTAVAAGNLREAQTVLDRETAGQDPALLGALLELQLTAGDAAAARALAASLREATPDRRDTLIDRAWRTAGAHPEAVYAFVSTMADGAAAAGDLHGAAALLQEIAARLPERQIPALERLIEVAVDAGLEEAMTDAQERLADAYLAAGQPGEARAIAEDLVARAPWVPGHIDRLRRLLGLMNVPDPDSVIAQRLGGDTPFTVTDPFAQPEREAEASSRNAAPIQPALAATDAAGAGKQAVVAGGQPGAARRPVPLSSAPPDPPGEIDVTGAVRDGHVPAGCDPAAALEETFQDFRREVARQSGVDHSAQHLTIARAYLDMGMPDQAMDPLAAAAQSPQLRFEAASLLGRILGDLGREAEAIEWLERAAEAPAPGVAEGRKLLYDLGCLVEGQGDAARALAIFMELRAEAGEYLDVTGRIARLSRVAAGG